MPDLAALRELALEQGGIFTVDQAQVCGWSPRRVQAAIDAREWQRLQPGVLVERDWRAALSAEARHVLDLRARLSFRADGWHAARRSALLLHGLPFIGRPPELPQLVRDKSVRSLRGHSRHERIAPLPVRDRESLVVPVTSVARAVADVARAECFRNGIVVADGAVRAGMAHADLEAVLARMRRWPHVSRAHHLVGEADGRAKYGAVEDLYAEKRREEGLRDLGLEVVRWGWDAAYRPGPELRSAVERGLRRGALNTLAPGVVFRSTARGLAPAA
ncbi:MAG: hypothetical protein M3P04_06445 [Actinomycetota bacterium]|nr:hypothetical protein [Actinomycetota bacterium]